MSYPALTDGASPPRREDFLLLPGNLLYTPSEKADLLPALKGRVCRLFYTGIGIAIGILLVMVIVMIFLYLIKANINVAVNIGKVNLDVAFST